MGHQAIALTGMDPPAPRHSPRLSDGSQTTSWRTVLHALDVVDEVGQFHFDGFCIDLARTLLAHLLNELLHPIFKQAFSPLMAAGFIIGMLFVAQ